MAQFNTAATLSAMHKEIYGDSLENLIPDGVKVLKKIPFASADKELSDNYIQPVQLSHEHGFSYGTGVFTLEDSIAAQYEEAQVQGKFLLLRTAISYSGAARMSNNKKSFVKWSELIVRSMVQSMSKRLEVQNMYGDSAGGIGRVDGAPVVAPATQAVVTIATAEWASGIWSGSEAMTLDCYDTTGATKRNAVGALTVDSVDLTARTVTLTGAAADVSAIADTDIFYFRNSKGAEGNGIDRLITNTGTLYNIDATQYSLWKGNTFSAGSAALSFSKVNAAVALAVERGLEDMVCCMVSPKTWTNLQADQAALRRFNSSADSKNAKVGPESIEYYGQNGVIEIVPSIYVKEGEAFIFCPKYAKRLGSTDVTFKMPGKSEHELYLQLPGQAGYELRCLTEQNLFFEAPAKSVKITGIVNT